MATDSPDGPEVDLGFRNPSLDNFVSAPNGQLQLPLSCPNRPREDRDRRWWSVPIGLVIGLSAMGALTTSVFLLNNPEGPSAIKRWHRDAYTSRKPQEPSKPDRVSDLRLDQRAPVTVGAYFTLFDGHSPRFDVSLEAVPFFHDASSPAPGSSPVPDTFVSGSSAVSAPIHTLTEKTIRDNATQTRHIRIAGEKMRRREIARRLRNRIAKRVAESAKSFASFWAVWSHQLFGPGLAIPTNTRRLAIRRSADKRRKASPTFPLSWYNIESPSEKRVRCRSLSNRTLVTRGGKDRPRSGQVDTRGR